MAKAYELTQEQVGEIASYRKLNKDKNVDVILKGNYSGNRRNLTKEQEKVFIDTFKEKAEKGELVTVKEIKLAYCEKIGHKCGNGQIYRVLKRQKWHKVVPRKEHPNKASEAEIETSKKLTFE